MRMSSVIPELARLTTWNGMCGFTPYSTVFRNSLDSPQLRQTPSASRPVRRCDVPVVRACFHSVLLVALAMAASPHIQQRPNGGVTLMT